VTGSISSFIAEPLGPEHDRASFTCESEALERYLKQQANQDIRKDLSITYVLVPSGDRRRIAGYYTLCSDTILIDDLPAELVLKLRLPRYRTIPATLIGRLARDLAFKGKGLGELLLSNALRLAWQVSQTVGSWAVTVDAKDDKARKFYEDFGFTPFADTPRRLYMPMKTVGRCIVG
jgi:GNAT superfamily N-acetyltransferase